MSIPYHYLLILHPKSFHIPLQTQEKICNKIVKFNKDFLDNSYEFDLTPIVDDVFLLSCNVPDTYTVYSTICSLKITYQTTLCHILNPIMVLPIKEKVGLITSNDTLLKQLRKLSFDIPLRC